MDCMGDAKNPQDDIVSVIVADHRDLARSSAPTHPHPSARDTPAGNVLAGPVTALFDRAREAAHHV